LELKFTLPSPDFDRDLVRGRVAKLFQLKEEKFGTALEAIAGSKLYHIVVDNDVAASMLLKNESFGYRVHLIPNNKIISKEVKKEVVDYVKNVTRGRARFALDLIKYHVHVENSMKYLFGNVLVCDDAETAKKLAFDPYVKLKTVTLEGDIYHPTGVLEGGHTSQEQYGMLKKVKEL
jgi:structural maintenance of chromosome 2